MYKLVHAWGRDRLEMDQQRELSVAALELLTDIVPAGRGDVVYRARLVPHVMANFDVVSTAYSLSTGPNDVLVSFSPWIVMCVFFVDNIIKPTIHNLPSERFRHC